MAKPIQDLLKKVSSVSVSAAALLAGSNAAGSPISDPDTAKRTQDALDALKRMSGADADQIRFHAGGQVDPHAQEILLAGHTSHSSHASGSYVRGDGSSSDYGSAYTPSSTPVYTPANRAPSYYAPSSAPAAASTYTPASEIASTSTVSLTSKRGARLAGSVIQKGSWGLQLLLKDTTRIQIPRRKLREEDIAMLELPVPSDSRPQDVPSTVYLHLNDGTIYTGLVSAADGERVTLTADDKTSRTFLRTQMDADTFAALQELTPDTSPPVSATSATPVAAVQTPPAQSTPVVIGQQVLIKLRSGSKMLVTLLSRTDEEITFRTKDGHEYRLQASRLSTETLAALGMPAAIPDTSPSPSPKRKKQA